MSDTHILAVADKFHADCRRERSDKITGTATAIVLGLMLGSMPWWEAIA
ncbi:hypothetical protein [Prescottella agglutinans]|uniref:Transposase n=1 Tax=Prescottella agglutinans TaxID=1644129 RepID=A0ABT6MEY8_9NOCA|nr:hypothetical protein [Prescottella agglutinans]MDH6282889.1 hypothetical protein [Prescottella agglutinans]